MYHKPFGHWNRRPQTLLLLGVAGLGIVVMIACRSKSADPGTKGTSPAAVPAVDRPARPASDGYVGSQACRQCHAEIADQYDTHPMAHSMAVATAETVPDAAQLPVSFDPGGICQYRVSLDNGQVLHHESLADSTGQPIYQQAVPVEFIIGSGVRGQSYLVHRDGILFQSPISWYASNQQWDLSPGYQPADARRFDRRITDQCLACHAGHVNALEDAADRYATPVFLEASIGCERCHGPGRAHIEYQSDDRVAAGSSEDPIINPASLMARPRESVCNQCHLSAVARIPRYGLREFDFRPGQDLGEVLTVLIAGTGVADDGSTKAVSHVQQMQASVCYQKTDSALGCTSCHDPHSRPAPAQTVAHYRDRCLKCHQQQPCSQPEPERLQLQPDDSCIACHMPPLAARDIAHTAQTDHRIVRRPRSGTAPQPSTLAVDLTFFDGGREHLADWEADRALGLAYDIEFTSTQNPAYLQRVDVLLTPVLRRAPDDLPVIMALGRLALRERRFEDAKRIYQQGLRAQPDHEGCLAGMATACYEADQYSEGLDYIDRLLQINPWYGHPYSVKADLLRRSGRLDEAIETALRGLSLNPRLPGLRQWLVDAYRANGEAAEATRQQELLFQIRRRLQEAR